MAYASWSVVANEQPSASKWNILGTNDASFNDGTGIGTGVIGNTQLATGVLVQAVSTGFSAVATGTTTIPFDDTIPQITEGDQYMTQAITPKSTTNILVIECQALIAASVGTRMQIGALFQDATANAIAASSLFIGASGAPTTLPLRHTMTAGTTSSTTFRFRSGAEAAATTTFNGAAGNREFGAITKSTMTIYEYKA